MKRGLKDRALSLLLVLSLLLGLAPAVYASGGGERTVTFEEASPDSVTANLTLEERQVEESPKQEPDENDMVRVSVVLEKAPVLDQGYSTMGLASNQSAQAYRQSLIADQQAVTNRISTAIGSAASTDRACTLSCSVLSVTSIAFSSAAGFCSAVGFFPHRRLRVIRTGTPCAFQYTIRLVNPLSLVTIK